MLNDAVLVNDWYVVAQSRDVVEGKPVRARLLGEDLVLWRQGDRLMVWQDLCIHRGTRLSLGSIQPKGLMCAYHGWTYNTDGQCVHIPAHPDQTPPTKARVKSYPVVERYGWVWTTLGEPAHDIPVFAEWDDSSYRKIHSGPYAYKATAPRAVENFLDVAHFPFVHAGYLGDANHATIEDYEATIGDDGVTASNITVWQPDPDGTGVGKNVTYTYRVYRPTLAYFVKTEKQRFSIFFPVTPVDEIGCIGWMCMAMNYAFDTPEEQIRSFQDEVTAQDMPIVESQHPERLPLDLQAELHLRCDRTSIAYRKWLKMMGVTIGTE